MVGDKHQGFNNTDGNSIVYNNVIFVNGTKQLEREDTILKLKLSEMKIKNKDERKTEISSS